MNRWGFWWAVCFANIADITFAACYFTFAEPTIGFAWMSTHYSLFFSIGGLAVTRPKFLQRKATWLRWWMFFYGLLLLWVGACVLTVVNGPLQDIFSGVYVVGAVLLLGSVVVGPLLIFPLTAEPDQRSQGSAESREINPQVRTVPGLAFPAPTRIFAAPPPPIQVAIVEGV